MRTYITPFNGEPWSKLFTMEFLAIFAIARTPDELLKPFLRDEEFKFFISMKEKTRSQMKDLILYHCGDANLSTMYNNIEDKNLKTYFEIGIENWGSQIVKNI